jgi:hypothetical protein
MYSTEQKQAFKDLIVSEVENKRSLNDMTENDLLGRFPSTPTVYTWLNENHKDFDPVFFKDYERAKDIRADKIFEEMLIIADTPQLGKTTKSGGTAGPEVIESDMIQHRRLQVDVRKWILGRMKPKKYGDKMETTITGGDKPIELNIYSKLSNSALEEIEAARNKELE